MEDFLRKNRIPYIDHGVNVKKGEINLKCPFCLDDPSMHLGVDENRLLFSCWRNSKHRGRLHKLIMVLARCSFAAACEMLGQNALWFDKTQFDNFMNDPAGFFTDTKEQKTLKADYPFKDYSDNIPLLYRNYLTDDRGFFSKHLPTLFKDYSLQYCTEGRYARRIIIPIFIRQELVTFTARAVVDNPVRYLTLSEKDGAIESIKETLFNFDDAEGEVLFVCEGPFDALKLDFYGKKLGARATCIFGKNIKPMQTLLLDEMSERFDRIVLLLDSTEFDTMLSVQRLISFIKKPVIIGTLPEGVGDPGELSIMQCKSLVKEYV
jgi:hypothetical protein